MLAGQGNNNYTRQLKKTKIKKNERVTELEQMKSNIFFEKSYIEKLIHYIKFNNSKKICLSLLFIQCYYSKYNMNI